MAFIPWPVVEGFTVGIAVIIFLQQFGRPRGRQADSENTAVVAARALGEATADAPQAVGLVLVTAVMVVG